jgi:hypothetical protein
MLYLAYMTDPTPDKITFGGEQTNTQASTIGLVVSMDAAKISTKSGQDIETTRGRLSRIIAKMQDKVAQLNATTPTDVAYPVDVLFNNGVGKRLVDARVIDELEEYHTPTGFDPGLEQKITGVQGDLQGTITAKPLDSAPVLDAAGNTWVPAIVYRQWVNGSVVGHRLNAPMEIVKSLAYVRHSTNLR